MFERMETPRLILRRPVAADAEAIYSRYASDPAVTRLLAWPRHTSIGMTHSFLGYCNEVWDAGKVGPLIIESRATGAVVGSTGLDYDCLDAAQTGYVLAKDAWGKGFATEALRAVMEIAARVGIGQLIALCHPENAASRHVLEKCQFVCDPQPASGHRFPNLDLETQDALRYTFKLR